MTIATRIKLYLKQNKITQIWLSSEAKIASSKLNASLNNKRKLPVEEYYRITKALNVEPNKFIEKDLTKGETL